MSERIYVENALKRLNALKKKGVTYRDMFIKINGREPSGKSELHTFTNRFKRGNPGCDFLGRVASAYPEIRDMTIGELLGVEEA